MSVNVYIVFSLHHCVTTTGRISGVDVYLFSIELIQLAVFLQLEVLVHQQWHSSYLMNIVWYIAVFSSLEVLTVISNILVMCIWLKPDIRSHVTIRLAVLSLSDSITVSFCHLFSIVTSYR